MPSKYQKTKLSIQIKTAFEEKPYPLLNHRCYLRQFFLCELRDNLTSFTRANLINRKALVSLCPSLLQSHFIELLKVKVRVFEYAIVLDFDDIGPVEENLHESNSSENEATRHSETAFMSHHDALRELKKSLIVEEAVNKAQMLIVIK